MTGQCGEVTPQMQVAWQLYHVGDTRAKYHFQDAIKKATLGGGFSPRDLPDPIALLSSPKEPLQKFE